MANTQVEKKVKNKRVPIIGTYTNRDPFLSKDQRWINCFPETKKIEQLEGTRIFLTKRPGLVLYKNFGAGEGRGSAYFNGAFYFAIGNKLWKDGTTPTAVITFTSSTGHVGMINGDSTTLGEYLFVCDGTKGYIIKTDGTVITISNDTVRTVNLLTTGSGYTSAPTVNITGDGTGAHATATVSGGSVTSVIIDNVGSGYTTASVTFTGGGATTQATGSVSLNAFPSPHIPTPTAIDGYILLAQNSDVFNSVLDDPRYWDSTNFLTAEMFPDRIVGLARQNNQVVVLGETSIEFFYDAANVSGSPLSRNESTTIQMGSPSPYVVHQVEQNCVYISQSESGGRAVWSMSGFTPKRVSDENIERILDHETDIANTRGFNIRANGHLLYVFNLRTLGRTIVYDPDEKLWHEWSTNSAGSHTRFAYDYLIDKGDGRAYLLHNSTGDVVYMDTSAYTDNGTSILVDVTTNRFDFDTYKRKFASSIKVVGDRYETGNYVNLTWSDNDYQTWSNVKQIDLTDDFPNFARLGCFRRRAFNIQHSLNYPLRMESLELTWTEGEH